MRVSFLVGQNIPLEIREIDKPKLVSGKVLIKIHYAALNHRDLWIRKGQYKGKSEGLILGSDGSGEVVGIGDNVNGIELGQEVVINPSLDWGTSPAAQKTEFRILGNPDPGTFAEYLLVEADQVFSKPAHLSLEEAAALPLAGLTAFRALFTRGNIQPNQNVLITGIGGGAAQFLLQFAISAKANVYVTSGDEAKMQNACNDGAIKGYNYKDRDWVKKAKETVQDGFDLIVDSAVGEGFADLVDVAKPGGKIVFFGGTAGPFPKIVPAKIFWKQLNILGTTMGSPTEFEAMLSYYEAHKLRPKIDKVFPLVQINEAFERMEKGDQTGKILIKIGE